LHSLSSTHWTAWTRNDQTQMPRTHATPSLRSHYTQTPRNKSRGNKAYHVNPKSHHRLLKIRSGLLPNTTTPPTISKITCPDSKVVDSPQEVIAAVHTHFQTDLARATPAEERRHTLHIGVSIGVPCRRGPNPIFALKCPKWPSN
jgi:hypothetical protein